MKSSAEKLPGKAIHHDQRHYPPGEKFESGMFAKKNVAKIMEMSLTNLPANIK